MRATFVTNDSGDKLFLNPKFDEGQPEIQIFQYTTNTGWAESVDLNIDGYMSAFTVPPTEPLSNCIDLPLPAGCFATEIQFPVWPDVDAAIDSDGNILIAAAVKSKLWVRQFIGGTGWEEPYVVYQQSQSSNQGSINHPQVELGEETGALVIWVETTDKTQLRSITNSRLGGWGSPETVMEDDIGSVFSTSNDDAGNVILLSVDRNSGLWSKSYQFE